MYCEDEKQRDQALEATREEDYEVHVRTITRVLDVVPAAPETPDVCQLNAAPQAHEADG